MSAGARPVLPEPEPGEMPIPVRDAARQLGVSREFINRRVRAGDLPSRMPYGYVRGRMVFLTQARALAWAPEGPWRPA